MAGLLLPLRCPHRQALGPGGFIGSPTPRGSLLPKFLSGVVPTVAKPEREGSGHWWPHKPGTSEHPKTSGLDLSLVGGTLGGRPAGLPEREGAWLNQSSVSLLFSPREAALCISLYDRSIN